MNSPNIRKLSVVDPLFVKSMKTEFTKYTIKRTIPATQNRMDNVRFSYFVLNLAKSIIKRYIMAKANRKRNTNEYSGILDKHISNITVTIPKNINSVLFIESPTFQSS